MYGRTLCVMSNYYYEVILVSVFETDIYIVHSDSTIDTYAYLYYNNFDPFRPSAHCMGENDDSGCNGHFRIEIDFTKHNRYILVITTYSPKTTGEFSIWINSEHSVNFTRIGE
jgi:hypothetical protein